MKNATIEELAYLIKYAKDNQNPRPIVFLGAGASKTAGIPLASEIVKDILEQYKDNPSVAGIKEENKTYPKLMECLLPEERNKLLKSYIDKARINITHICLAQLITEGYVDYVLTVNFDNLMLRALALCNEFPPVYDMAVLKDLTTTAFKEKSVVYLHGQHHGLWLLNTTEEMGKVDTIIPRIIDPIKNRRAWIFMGYSGEDRIFQHIVKLGRFDNGLYWVGYNSDRPRQHVCEELLEKANTNAYLVEGFDSDTFMLKLSIELGIQQPAILEKPFSSLKTMLDAIVDIDDSEEFKAVKERLKLAKENVEAAINQFEKGEVAGNKELQGEVAQSLLKLEIINLQLSKTYDTDKLKDIEQKVLATNSEEIKALLAKVYVGFSYNYNNQKQSEKAIESSNKAIELSPINDTAYNNRGAAYNELKQYDRAIEDHTKAIELNPNNDNAYNNRGAAYNELEQYDRAIEDYTKAIELNPNMDGAYYNRGTAYNGLKQYDNAIEDFNKAIELNPNNASAYNNRGYAYKQLKQYDNAIENYTKAIELNPNMDGAYYNRGTTYTELKQYDNAIKDYTKAIELNPNDAVVYNNRGFAYNELKQYDNAIEDFNKAIELNPNNASAYNNRGAAYNGLKQYDNAIADLTKAIELNPDNDSTYNNRGFAYNGLKQYDNAIVDYTKAIELNPDNDNTYNNRGFAYNGLEQYDNAIADFDRAIAINNKSPNPYKHRGVAYTAKRVYNQALADLNKAIELNPVYWKAYEARATLYGLMGDADNAAKDTAQAIALKERNK